MAEIMVLPGVERRDIGEDLPSHDVLMRAAEAGLLDVVIVGRDRSGELYMAGSIGDADKTVGILMRAVNILANSTIEHL